MLRGQNVASLGKKRQTLFPPELYKSFIFPIVFQKCSILFLKIFKTIAILVASLAFLAWACGDAKHYGRWHVAAQSCLLCSDYKLEGGEKEEHGSNTPFKSTSFP